MKPDAMTVQYNRSIRWWLWPACFLFFLMLVFPMAINFLYLKAALFAFLLVLVVIQGVRRVHLHPRIVAWTVVISAASVIFGLRGLLLGAPGALKCIEVYALWPLVYLVLLSGIRSIRAFQSLEKTLVFSTAFIALFLVVYLSSELHVIPEVPGLHSLFSSNELESGLFLSATFKDGHIELGFTGIASYFFLVPFLVAALMDRWLNFSGTWAGKFSLIGALLLSVTVVILSGRRALQLVTILAPLMTMIAGLFCPKNERLLLVRSFGRIMLLMLGVPILSLWFFNSAQLVTAEGLSERFSAGFDFSASNRSDSAVGRIDQYLALVDGWEQAPFIGNGLGAAAHRSIRQDEMPWIYELSYVDLLFQTGLLGLIIYSWGIAWIYWYGIKIVKAGGEGCRFMLPALVGLTGLLIANGTNPYLARFDGIWVIFLPLAFINHWLLTHKRDLTVSTAAQCD
jgi:hypothetical protein